MNQKPTNASCCLGIVGIFALICVLGAVLSVIMPKSTNGPKNTPNFLKIKGLETVKLFEDMRSDDSYYGKVVRNPNDYHKLVGDKRIYNKDKATLIYQYHCYYFFKYHGSMHDMKIGFLGAFLVKYHGLTYLKVDNLASAADEYAQR